MVKKVDYTSNPLISSLIKPCPKAEGDKRAWSIPVFGVWVPFYTAKNATGEAHISHEALGAPVRLAKDGDGSIKFTKSGRPALKLVKELADQVRIVKDNLVASLVTDTQNIRQAMPDAYKAQVEANQKAGEAIYRLEQMTLTNYLETKVEANAEPAKEPVPVGA